MKNYLLLFIAFIVSSSYSFAEYDVKWRNIIGMSYNSSTNILTKNSGNSWSHGALSYNKLKAEENGSISFEITSPTANQHKMVGLSNYNNNGSHSSIKYAIYYYVSGIQIRESGAYKYSGGSAQLGDVYTIERLGNNVYYKRERNGVVTTIYTSTASVDPNEELYADCSIYYNGASLSNVKSTFGYIDCDATLTHIDPENNVLTGSISISNITGAVGSYSLSWSNGSTNSNLSNLQEGTYTLTITDGLGGIEQREFKIGYKTKWVNVAGYSYTSSLNSISKVTGGNNWNDGVAISANKLKGNHEGSVKYAVENITDSKIRFFGLSNYNTTSGYPSIKYSIETYNDDVFIIESGNINHSRLDILQIGDELEVERADGTIYYSRVRNGKKWTFYETNTSVMMAEDLYVDMNFYSSGTSMNNIVSTFDIPIDISSTVTHIDLDNNTQGQINLTVSGASGPYTYSWNNGSTTQDLNNVAQGDYIVTVTDVFGFTNTKNYTVDYLVKWRDLVGTSYDEINNIVTNNSYNSWCNSRGLSKNKLRAGVDGYIEYKISNTSMQMFLGFTTVTTSSCYHTIKHAIHQQYGNFKVYENGAQKFSSFGSLQSEDIVKVELHKTAGTVSYIRVRDGESLLLYTSPLLINNNEESYADFRLNAVNTSMSEVTCSFTSSNSISYAELNPKLNGSYYKLEEDDILRFHYVEEYQDLDGNLDYKIYPVGRTTPLTLPAQSVVYGNNYYEIDLSTIQLRDHFILEVTNEKKEKQYLRFYHNGLTTSAPCSGCATE